MNSQKPPPQNNNIFRITVAAMTTDWVQRIIAIGSSLITFPLVLIHLGKNEYAIWVLVGQLIGLLALSDLGVSYAVSRFIARFRGQGDHEAINRLLSTVLAYMALVCAVVLLVTVWFAPWVPGWLGLDGAYAEMARVVFLITGVSVAFQFPIQIGMGILMGYQFYGPHWVGKISESVLLLATIILLGSLNQLTILSLAVACASISFISDAIVFFIAWRMTRPWRLSLSKISIPLAKDAFSLGSSVLIITLGSLAYNQGMGILLGRTAGLGAVAIFGVALTIIANLQPLIGAISNAIPTLASEWQARGDTAPLSRVINLMMRLTFSLAACATVGIYFYGAPLLQLLLNRSDWTPQDFSSLSLVLLVMGIGLTIGLPQLVSRAALQATGEHWSATGSVAIASFLSLAAGGLAIAAGWGVLGAAIGWSLVLIFQGTMLFPRMICRFLGQSIGEMLKRAYLPGLAPILLVGFIAWGITMTLAPTNLTNIIVGIIGCGVVGGLSILGTSGEWGSICSRFRVRMS
jgi:O-antigen/teichoic acid export membrane protein